MMEGGERQAKRLHCHPSSGLLITVSKTVACLDLGPREKDLSLDWKDTRPRSIYETRWTESLR